MCRTVHTLLVTAALLLSCTALQARERLRLGMLHSPKGVGVTALFCAPESGEMDIITLRTDFYGLLSGRTRDVGACLAYTHDYILWTHTGPDHRLRLHAGAGGQLGYVHDFEPGLFSANDRQLLRNPGGMASVTGNLGLCVDLGRRFTLDVGFSVAPGVHLRTDRRTGTLLVSFYRNGVFNAYLPQVNLMYRF